MGHNILFIEDDPDTCVRIGAAFASADTHARLEFVPTVAACFEFMQRESIDAVVVNESGSGMTAPEFLRSLNAAGPRVPIILMSPSDDEQAVLKALREGAADCIAARGDAISTYPAVVERAIARSRIARESTALAEETIRSQKQWMSILDAITDFIYVIDATQTIVKVNNAFSTAIGSHPRIIVGKKIEEVFSLDIPNEEFLREVHRDGMPRTYEKKIGDEIYQISIYPLREDDQYFTIHVMKNITEVRRLKDQLYHADKLASIGLLVSGVAHEINNPLTGTIAYTELLSMKTTDESVKAELKKILDSAERCKKIVDNLMTFSRQRTPSKSLESVNDIIDRAVDLRNYWLKSNSIEIARDYDPVSTVFVDGQQIQQVVLNLLLNAEQAIAGSGRTGGRVSFKTRFHRELKRVIISVADNGPGIPEKVAQRIFDPFYTTKPVGIGTGLGLSISHGIITEHGGSIRFENGEAGGAVFTIELPTGTASFSGAAAVRESERVK